MNCECASLADCTGACVSAVYTEREPATPRIFSYISPRLVMHFNLLHGTAEDLRAAHRCLEVLIGEQNARN